LWTRQVVQELLLSRSEVELSLASIGALLARLGLTPQKPLQRAYPRDPEAVERWKNETFPAIAAQAQASGAEVLFWDESGFRADAVHGKTWAARGQTPVIERPGQHQTISAASAVSAKGAFWFATYEGGLTGELFVGLDAADMVWLLGDCAVKYRPPGGKLLMPDAPTLRAEPVEPYLCRSLPGVFACL
jgi:hypothetical protein